MSAVVTKERPILFSGPMIRAILEGRKTQTRRIIKLPAWSVSDWDDFETDGKDAQNICADTGCLSTICCPYGKPGDRLWVRETWANLRDSDIPSDEDFFIYRATESDANISSTIWKPSIHMFRKASRITLEITNVRVERLQDITEEDAIAEGVPPFEWDDGGSLRPIPAFAKLWDSINGKTYPWESNPWLWIVEFKRIDNAIATQQPGGAA